MREGHETILAVDHRNCFRILIDLPLHDVLFWERGLKIACVGMTQPYLVFSSSTPSRVPATSLSVFLFARNVVQFRDEEPDLHDLTGGIAGFFCWDQGRISERESSRTEKLSKLYGGGMQERGRGCTQ